MIKAMSRFGGELKESFVMAMSAVVSHKLRSALTLLGVLVGVFSIIVVMTSMRAMEQNIESNLNSLGGQTFVVQTWSHLHFEGGGSEQSDWRRKRIDLALGQEVSRRATLALSVGLEDNDLTSGEMTSRYAKGPPNIQVTGETPGSFPAQNWVVAQGRGLLDSDVSGLRDVCVLGSTLAEDLFPHGSPLGERVALDGISTRWLACSNPRGAWRVDGRTTSPSSPSPRASTDTRTNGGST